MHPFSISCVVAACWLLTVVVVHFCSLLGATVEPEAVLHHTTGRKTMILLYLVKLQWWGAEGARSDKNHEDAASYRAGVQPPQEQKTNGGIKNVNLIKK